MATILANHYRHAARMHQPCPLPTPPDPHLRDCIRMAELNATVYHVMKGSPPIVVRTAAMIAADQARDAYRIRRGFGNILNAFRRFSEAMHMNTPGGTTWTSS